MNLLPENEKKGLRQEYFLRLAIVGLFLGSTVVLAGAASLLPAFFFLQVKENSLETAAASLQEIAARNEASGLTVQLKDLNFSLATLSEKRALPHFEDVLAAVTEARPVGIRVFALRIEEIKDHKHRIFIDGVAPQRPSLVTFVKKLEETKLFTNVVFPVSNLTQSKNIIFSLSADSSF